MKQKINKELLEKTILKLEDARENCYEAFKMTTYQIGAFDLNQTCFALWLMLNGTIELLNKTTENENQI